VIGTFSNWIGDTEFAISSGWPREVKAIVKSMATGTVAQMWN
jgi:hypothetical protein